MNVLFVTYGRLSVGAGDIRSVSMLRALADAGNHVDVIAADFDLDAHPNIQVLSGDASGRPSRRRMRQALKRALRSKTYQVLHAVDHAAVHAARSFRPKKTRMVYQPSRCFTGMNGEAPSWFWKLFPTCCRRMEKNILHRASVVFSSCDELSADIAKVDGDTHIIQIEDIPAQPLFPRFGPDGAVPDTTFPGGVSFLVVCCVLPGNRGELRTLMLAARKVVERIPLAGFIFKGLAVKDAQALAANLEIEERCVFLSDSETGRFLAALSAANAALFVPRPGGRYCHPEILTLLNSPALVVAVHESAYAAMLTDRNSMQVDFTASSIAEGLLRVVQEPLIAFGVVADAQQQIADRNSFSSFKHKVRMAYHDLTAVH
jgi:hypothetical protein